MNKEERINEIYEKQNQKIIYLILNFNLSKTDLCKTLNLDLENLERRINSINDTELKNKIQMLLSKNNSEMSNETKKKVTIYLMMEKTKEIKEQKEAKYISELAKQCKQKDYYTKLTNEDRLSITKYRVKNSLSRDNICDIFNIPNDSFIRSWEQKITDPKLKIEIQELNEYYDALFKRKYKK